MPDILDKIFSDKKEELDEVKRKLSLSDVKNRIA
ncbi:MAG: indole-3-glycerol phosphate synthase, partial [Nitrospina sp.]|nr:indole-3-glycerol phosphate synthase [Nitrospina sp.]